MNQISDLEVLDSLSVWWDSDSLVVIKSKEEILKTINSAESIDWVMKMLKMVLVLELYHLKDIKSTVSDEYDSSNLFELIKRKKEIIGDIIRCINVWNFVDLLFVIRDILNLYSLVDKSKWVNNWSIVFFETIRYMVTRWIVDDEIVRLFIKWEFQKAEDIIDVLINYIYSLFQEDNKVETVRDYLKGIFSSKNYDKKIVKLLKSKLISKLDDAYNSVEINYIRQASELNKSDESLESTEKSNLSDYPTTYERVNYWTKFTKLLLWSELPQ